MSASLSSQERERLVELLHEQIEKRTASRPTEADRRDIRLLLLLSTEQRRAAVLA